MYIEQLIARALVYVCACGHVSYSRLLAQRWNWSIPPSWRRCTCIPQNPGSWPAGSAGHPTAAAWTWEPGPSRWPIPEILRRDAYNFWLTGDIKHTALKVSAAMCVVVPFLQVMAGLGAPPVWQENTAVCPSVTVWSVGGKVNLGATPATQREVERRGGGGNSLVIDCVSSCRCLINFPEFTGLNRILAAKICLVWVWRVEL